MKDVPFSLLAIYGLIVGGIRLRDESCVSSSTSVMSRFRALRGKEF